MSLPNTIPSLKIARITADNQSIRSQLNYNASEDEKKSRIKKLDKPFFYLSQALPMINYGNKRGVIHASLFPMPGPPDVGGWW